MKSIDISIAIDGSSIQGILTPAASSRFLVIFAHGSGSSRFSKRNQFVAQFLNQNGLSTFLFDLLTPEEEKIDEVTRQFRFDISMLADRLVYATTWLESQGYAQKLKIGYFGSSTGAAGALIAAAKLPDAIAAVVSRGGRPDLAESYLPLVKAATLLIVGQNDPEVIQLNQMAFDQLTCRKEMKIIPHATHLFEEPGTLEQVAEDAAEWFTQYK